MFKNLWKPFDPVELRHGASKFRTGIWDIRPPGFTTSMLGMSHIPRDEPHPDDDMDSASSAE